MPDVGALLDIVYEQNVKFFIGPAVTRTAPLTASSVPDRVTLMTGLDLDVEFPEDRFDWGRDRDYSHATPDVGLEAIILMDKAMVGRIKTMATQNAQNILPIHALMVENTPAGGTAADTKRVIARGKLTRFRTVKPEGGAKFPIAMRCFFRLLDYTNVTASFLPA